MSSEISGTLLKLIKQSPPLFRALRAARYGLRQSAAALGLGQPVPPDEIRQARQIIAQSRPQPNSSTRRGPKILFFTLRAWATHLAWETTIAHGLIQRGANCEFFLCSREQPACDVLNWHDHSPAICDYCARYSRNLIKEFGLPYHLLRDVIGPSDLAQARWMVDQCSPADYENFEYAGLPLGQYVQPSVAHFLCAGTIGQDPLSRHHYREFLISNVLMLEASRRLLDKCQPDILFLTNGLFFAERTMVELARARHLPFVTYEAGFLDNSLIFAHGRPAADVEIPELWEQVKNQPFSDAQSARLGAYLETRRRGERSVLVNYWPSLQEDREKICATLRLDPNRPVVTLFSNILWDTAIYRKDIAFPSMLAWVVDTIAYFAHHPDVQLIVRVHPAEIRLAGQTTRERVGEAIQQNFRTLPQNVVVVPAESDISSYVLTDLSVVGLVYSSTIGLEMALAGKPVVVAGETHYRGKGFTHDVVSPEDYHETIRRLLAAGEAAPEPYATELARRYAYAFFFRFMLPFPLVTHLGPNRNRFNYTRLSDLAPGTDASLDLICSAILEGREFVAPDEPRD